MDHTSADPSTLHARFNPLIKPYLVITIGAVMVSTIFGIPLAIIWFLGVGRWWAQHYFDKLECQLSDRTLRFRKGILVQVEKTIPLENIQDVTFVEGPILRRFNLSTLRFETAGQGSGNGNEMRLTGIIDAHDFRSRILEARDRLKESRSAPQGSHDTAEQTLAALVGVGEKMDQIIELLKRR